MAQRAARGRLGRGACRSQSRTGRDPAAPARGQAARRRELDLAQGRGFFRQGDRVTKFAFVAAERANHAIATLCRVVGASVSGFYAWLRAIPSRQNRAEAEAELRGHISRIFAAKRRVYGARKLTLNGSGERRPAAIHSVSST